MTISKPWAFLIHVTLSLMVFSTLVITMYYLWFPGELFMLDGGWQGLKLVAIIDLVLGPLLTLVLYKPGKKGLVGDMAAIACFQFAALGYGFYATYSQQTMALVFSEGTFNTISLSAHKQANEEILVKAKEDERDLKPQDLQTFRKNDNARGPAMIFTQQPGKSNFGSLLADALNGYPEPQERSDNYVALSTKHAGLQKRQLTIESLEENGHLAMVQKKLKQLKLSQDDVEFYRFKARYGRGIAILDLEKMRIVGYAEIKRKPVTVASTES